MNRDYVLETCGLSRSFGSIKAVSSVDLRVKKGGVHALIGPNGAGKTTLFNLLTKTLAPTSGTIMLDSEDITRLSSAKVARRGLVRSFQISSIFSDLTVAENIRVGLQRYRHGTSFDFWRSERVLEHLNDEVGSLASKVGLAEHMNDTAGLLSYGRKRALEIATAMACDPEVLLLDEPMAGLGTEEIGRIGALIASLAVQKTILMVEHNLKVVADLSDRITVMAFGEIIAEGDYTSVSSDPKVIEAYIGSQVA